MIKFITKNKQFIKLLFSTIILFFCVDISVAQPALPQSTITVTATQSLHFGTICAMGWPGGTVILGWDGSRSSTGNVLLLPMSPTSQPAIFEVKLCDGSNVSINYDANSTLSGSNGGSLTLDLGPTDKGPNGASFATNSDCNFVTTLYMGGTLHISGNPIPGMYTGSFAITFNQQ